MKKSVITLLTLVLVLVNLVLTALLTFTIMPETKKANELITKVADAIDLVFDIFRRCNKYIDETMPWVLAKDESKQDRLSTVLYNLVESIRYATVLLQAFMPDTANKIFEQINTDKTGFDTLDKFGYYESGSKVGKAEVLFQRIDIKK